MTLEDDLPTESHLHSLSETKAKKPRRHSLQEPVPHEGDGLNGHKEKEKIRLETSYRHWRDSESWPGVSLDHCSGLPGDIKLTVNLQKDEML